MGLEKLNNGERIAAISAMLLFVFMFFDWFGTKDAGELRLFSVGRSAWEALDYIPIVLVVTIIVTLAAAVLRLTSADRKQPFPVNAVVALFGIVSALLIIFRIAEPPNFGSFQEVWGKITIEGTVQLPIFLALLAAVGVAFGGGLATREEGFSFNDIWAR